MSEARPAVIALLAGILPVATAFIAYAIALYQGHLPACIPMIEGCISVSATGRQGPESLVFRAMMIPAAMLMMLFWYLMRQWLKQIEGQALTQQRVIQVLGMLSAVFLIVYTVALGFIGDAYSLQRRIGVILFFSFTLIAQLMTADRIWKQVLAQRLCMPYQLHRVLLINCLLMLIIGLASIPLQLIYNQDSKVDNILEWSYATVMYSYFIVCYFIWRVTDFRVGFRLVAR